MKDDDETLLLLIMLDERKVSIKSAKIPTAILGQGIYFKKNQ